MISMLSRNCMFKIIGDQISDGQTWEWEKSYTGKSTAECWSGHIPACWGNSSKHWAAEYKGGMSNHQAYSSKHWAAEFKGGMSTLSVYSSKLQRRYVYTPSL